MSSRNRKKVVLAFMAAAAATGILWLGPRRQDMPGLLSWKPVLTKRHGKTRAQWLAEQTRQRYHQLLAERRPVDNCILSRHVTQNILPGLALYQVLLQDYGNDQQAALSEIAEAFRAWTLAKDRLLLAPLKIAPRPFRLFRLAFGARMKAFPAEGWDFEIVENSTDRIAFNATRCFYLNTLAAYGAPELTASFCKMDEVMAELFPPSIRFVRPHTLGRGDVLCDFQYCSVG